MAKTKVIRNTSKAKPGRFLKGGVILLFITSLILGYWGYNKFYKANVRIENENNTTFLYIHTGASFEQVLSSLVQNKYLCDPKSFEWMAMKMNYPNNIKPGKYKITDGMTNRSLLNMLRSGNQVPVKVVFNNARLKNDLASDVSKYIEADSVELLNVLNNNRILEKYNVNKETALVLFIPNTYEFYWNTSAEKFIERMYKEYQKFWNENRLKKAQNLNLDPVKVSILASIVEEESNVKSERPTIAGVYINRIKKDMPLQADPTVKFAYGDFSIKRVLDKHISFDSPYNTYKYKGIPPGPICIPSISSIDAVLNYQKHDYIFFCAKADNSGTHAFARTLAQHNENARKYREFLNKAKIYR